MYVYQIICSKYIFPDFCSHNLVTEETAECIKAQYYYSSDIKCISSSPSIGIFFSFGMCCILSLSLSLSLQLDICYLITCLRNYLCHIGKARNASNANIYVIFSISFCLLAL